MLLTEVGNVPSEWTNEDVKIKNVDLRPDLSNDTFLMLAIEKVDM